MSTILTLYEYIETTTQIFECNTSIWTLQYRYMNTTMLYQCKNTSIISSILNRYMNTTQVYEHYDYMNTVYI